MPIGAINPTQQQDSSSSCLGMIAVCDVKKQYAFKGCFIYNGDHFRMSEPAPVTRNGRICRSHNNEL